MTDTMIARQLFDELDSLLRVYRHDVHSQDCECLACRTMLRDLIALEQKWEKIADD